MRVAVLGAGYAGLAAARRLERRLPESVELVVVDESPDHLLKHELHRLVRFPTLEDDLQVPLEEVLDRAEVRTARVDELDADDGVATLSDGTELTYDYGVLAVGSRTAFYDLPGVEEHALPLQRPADAEAIRHSFLDDPATVVGGAGLSGVQVAGELAAFSREVGRSTDVTLVERLETVAPGFPESFQTAVREELADLGVTVRTGVAVERATDEAVHLAPGERLDYGTFVWTGGIRGSDTTGGDRPTVRADLRLGERTFGVGDAVRVVDADGEAVPASAATATREARVAADNVTALVEHERSSDGGFRPRLDRYEFDVPGWVVSVGDGAVAKLGPTVLRGTAARAAKTTVAASYLGSVGSVSRATDLVREELEWPAAFEGREGLELGREDDRAETGREDDEAEREA